MQINKEKGIRRVIKAFANSKEGLRYALKEDAFFQELILGLILTIIIFFLDVSKVDKVILFSTILLVLIVEVLNTAIETAIDRISDERHELSKKAKDLGSFAVLLSLINLIVVWLVILV